MSLYSILLWPLFPALHPLGNCLSPFMRLTHPPHESLVDDGIIGDGVCDGFDARNGGEELV